MCTQLVYTIVLYNARLHTKCGFVVVLSTTIVHRRFLPSIKAHTLQKNAKPYP